MKMTSFLIGTALLATCAAPLTSLGQSCCGPTCAPSSAQKLALGTRKLELNNLAQTVVEKYLTVQTALAKDSLEKVPASARILAQAVRADTARTFPAQVAAQADALAQARDLAAARKAFQALSTSLVQYTQAGTVPSGAFYEVYCPMAKAAWLQTGPTVRNPYFGPAMLDCGQIVTTASASGAAQAETASAPAPPPAPSTPSNQHSHH